MSKFTTDFAGRQLDSITRLEARAWALANRSRVESVRAMFSDAHRDGLVADNPFSNLRLREPDGRKHLVVPTDEELGELAQAAVKLQGECGRLVLAPFILFAAHTGLRPGELYALRWHDINLTGNTVAVGWQWSQPERRLVRPKYDSTRVVFLPPAARDALDAVARVRAEVFSAPRGGRLSGTVMGHKDGGKLAMDRYIHVTERDAREKVAAAFGSNVRELRPVSEAGAEA